MSEARASAFLSMASAFAYNVYGSSFAGFYVCPVRKEFQCTNHGGSTAKENNDQVVFNEISTDQLRNRVEGWGGGDRGLRELLFDCQASKHPNHGKDIKGTG
jgi:hypothetical protein